MKGDKFSQTQNLEEVILLQCVSSAAIFCASPQEWFSLGTSTLIKMELTHVGANA